MREILRRLLWDVVKPPPAWRFLEERLSSLEDKVDHVEVKVNHLETQSKEWMGVEGYS